jgi:hypothetical protein
MTELDCLVVAVNAPFSGCDLLVGDAQVEVLECRIGLVETPIIDRFKECDSLVELALVNEIRRLEEIFSHRLPSRFG